jgi:hypothetical protein
MSLVTDAELAQMEEDASNDGLVAYIGWDRYNYFESAERAKKKSKIHVGRITGQFGHRNMTIRPLCHYHAGHIQFGSDNSLVFDSRIDSDRICSNCAEKYPGFWRHLQTIPPKTKQYYILIMLEKGDQQSTIRIKETFGELKYALRGRPDFIEALEKREKNFQHKKVDLLYATPGLYIFKGSFVDIKAKIQTVVEDIVEVKEE